MPTYHARSITVRLGSMPLAETTTSCIVLKKGEVAKRQSEAAEEKLLRSFLLDEKRVLFPGDPDGYELNWLGNAPFMQVQANGGFTQPSGPYDGSYRSNTCEDSRPQALSLHVKLSDKSFISGPSGKTHLKIEVLFNGQLSTCSLVHTNDIRSGAKSPHQVFAGSRADFLAERPWVILPPYTSTDGGTRRFRKTIAPTQRWTQISDALRKEAEDRGTNKDGESPPSAEFLRALANMQMPETIKDMQKPGGRKFGVVDVVITAGMGSKLTTGINYLKSPQRLKDSDYTVRTKTRMTNEASTSELDQTQDATETPGSLDAYTDAEEDSDARYERPSKRRALSLVATSSQPTLQNSSFASPFSGMQIPYLPPPKRITFRDDLVPVAGRVSPRCPSLEHRSDGHKEPLPLNDFYRTNETERGDSKAQNWSNDASRIFQEYRFPPPNLQASSPRTLSVHPIPISMSFTDTMIGHHAFGGPPIVTSTLGSSPMLQAFGNYSAFLAQPSSPDGTEALVSPSTSSPHVPYAAPTALMHPAITGGRGPPNTMSTPYHCSTYLPQQSPLGIYSSSLDSHMRPNGLPDLPPHMTSFFTYPEPAHCAILSTPSPAIFPSSGQLPPTAMFTVTSKPKQSASPIQDMATIGLNASRASLIVDRLVITGLNGLRVVDHRWKVPQHIVVNHSNSNEVIVGERGKTSSSEHHAPTARSVTWKQGTSCNTHPRTKSLNKNLRSNLVEKFVHGQRPVSIQDGQVNQAISLSLPYLQKHQGPTNKDLPVNPKIDIPDKIAPFVSVPLPTTTTTPALIAPVQTSISASSVRPNMPQRRALPRNASCGVQGPKAATFLLDDPEEVIREAARMRRSRSPTKLEVTLSVPSIMPLTRIGSSTDQIGPSDSSPLSSVPSSPVPEITGEEYVDTVTTLDHVLQLDGSPERRIPAALPRPLQTPSPTKSSFPTSKIRPPGLATPKTPVLPEQKKRKASHRSTTKPPRSPDRLRTVGNPPLNDDCVIAFAESEDKGDERGVLRQVKGERQGVFKEEYVVLAVRFFVAGG
ncbi:hypothetical protein EKO04_009951 [Ascochyta lentis]|uniref:Uncharacterized protein n=1 Tax=Ascochyta lentis TaxID=205686 RepID=A0A8H7IU11_9PLEO|nr:hypothetical protein EKO04_009951 [Ascochyta lentis]